MCFMVAYPFLWPVGGSGRVVSSLVSTFAAGLSLSLWNVPPPPFFERGFLAFLAILYVEERGCSSECRSLRSFLEASSVSLGFVPGRLVVKVSSRCCCLVGAWEGGVKVGFGGVYLSLAALSLHIDVL